MDEDHQKCKELLKIPNTWQSILQSVNIDPEAQVILLVYNQLDKRIQGTCLDPPTSITQYRTKLYYEHNHEIVYPPGADVHVCLAQQGTIRNEHYVRWTCFISRDKKQVFL